MYTITNTQWSFKKVAEEMKKGTINFKCGGAQRGFVWDKARQSLFVHSGLRGDLIPCLYVRRIVEKEVEKNVYKSTFFFYCKKYKKFK